MGTLAALDPRVTGDLWPPAVVALTWYVAVVVALGQRAILPLTVLMVAVLRAEAARESGDGAGAALMLAAGLLAARILWGHLRQQL